MDGSSDTMTEKLESFGSVLKQKMKDIYEHHQKVSQGIEDQVSRAQEENTKLQRLNERLTNEVDLLQERLNGLEADNKRLSGELVNTSTRMIEIAEDVTINRLSAPCENCKSLMQQLEQQNKLVYTLMEKHDLSITSILEKYLKGTFRKQVLTDRNTEARSTPTVLNVLSQALQDSAAKSHENLQDPHSECDVNIKKTLERQQIPFHNENSKTYQKDNEQIDDLNPPVDEQIQTDKNESSIRVGKYEREGCGEISPGGCDQISPTNTKLKLNRAGKRSRHKYIEQYVPDSKRKKTSTGSVVISKKRNVESIQQSKDYNVLATDTCNLSTVGSPKNGKEDTDDDIKTKRHTKNGSKQSVKSVPETVPMDKLDMSGSDESYESGDTEKPKTQLFIQDCKRSKREPVTVTDQDAKLKAVNHLLSSVMFSPPSHSSTPLPVSPEASTKRIDIDGSFLLHKETSNQDNSPTSSPVFGKSNSPLFDESTNISGNAFKHQNLPAEIGKTLDLKSKSNKKSKPQKNSLVENKSYKSYIENNASLSANESSLLLSKPSSLNTANVTQSPGRQSYSTIEKLSHGCRMSPLNFSVERPGEAKIKSPEVSKSPSVLSGKIKCILTSPVIKPNKRQSKTRISKVIVENGTMKKMKGKYFQTKLTSDTFKTKNINKSRLKEYNGRSNGFDIDTLTQQEEDLIEKARIASLQENLADSAKETKECPKAEVITSTPSVKSHRPGQVLPDVSAIDQSDSELLFKKPVPPSTPRSVKTESVDMEVLRRSPRFKKIIALEDMENIKISCDLNGTVDPNVNLAEFDSPGTLQSQYLENVSVNDNDRIQNAAITQDYLTSMRHESGRVTRANSKASQEVFRANPNINQISRRRQSQRSQRSMTLKDLKDNLETEMSEKSVVFGAVSPTRQSDNQKTSDCNTDYVSGLKAFEQNSSVIVQTNHFDSDDSFDRLPEQVDEKGYKYVKVVRKKEERAKLDTYVCIECDKWFNGMGLSDEEKRQRMKAGCKHKALFAPPDTPEHYWSVGFPDTQQCKERGYMNTTQAKPSKYRRQKPLRQLFKVNTVSVNGEEEEASDFSD